jgi:putative cardiolipin synthase
VASVTRFAGLCAAAVIAFGCATLPPGAEQAKSVSTGFDQPLSTRLGRQAAAQASAHPGESGMHLFARGVDGLVLRTQLVNAAQRSLDIQYFIFVEDDTGKVLLDAVLNAARRGVRVRLLVDDFNLYGRPQTRATLAALNHHPNIEVRLFNPLAYRGDVPLLHALDLVLNAPRVNHRMHNKLLVADNAVAVVGGRNVSDAYFELGAAPIRFGDFDLAVIGPVVPELSKSFDAFWNCALSIPQEAVGPITTRAERHDAHEALHEDNAATDLPRLRQRIDSGAPLSTMVTGGMPMAWGRTAVIADPPEKAEPGKDGADSPTAREIDTRWSTVSREFIVISPYFVPGPEGLKAFERLRDRGVRVRVLTNSLASTDVPSVHSAYRRYREPLLEDGVELYEVRPVRGQPRQEAGALGSGASGAPFALHAKAYVFDRSTVFLGSANLDPRSLALNTEVGLVIESPDLAREIVARFEEFAGPANSYRVTVAPDHTLVWQANVEGRDATWGEEPDTTAEQRLKVDLLSLLPIEPLL